MLAISTALFSTCNAVDFTTATIPGSAFTTSETTGDRYVLEVLSHVSVSNDTTAEGQAEYFTWDNQNKRIFVANTAARKVDMYSIGSLGSVTFTKSLQLQGDPNSVAYSERDNVLAVAVNDPAGKTAGGMILFVDATTLAVITSVNTSTPLPDHVSFGPSESCLYSANEGEPGITNPFGGVTSVCSVDFRFPSNYGISHSSFADLSATTIQQLKNLQGIHNPSNSLDIGVNLEPEFLTYSHPDDAGKYEIYVSTQETNAIVVYEGNTQTPLSLTIEPIRIMPLGFKDHSLAGNGLDLYNDDSVNIKTYPGLFGMYQPDTVKFFTQGNKNYIITANEGDQNEEEEDVAVSKLPTGLLFPFGDPIEVDFGKYKVSRSAGKGVDGNYTKAFAFGGRSFGVFDADTGALVHESGDQMEQMMKNYAPEFFNIDSGVLGVEARSKKKGPEPESLTLGVMDGKNLLFVGLERPGLIGIWDIDNIVAPVFHSINTVITNCREKSRMMDPEALHFVSAQDSPVENIPLLIASGSVSSTITVFKVVKLPSTTTTLKVCDRLTTVAVSGVVDTSTPTSSPTSTLTHSPTSSAASLIMGLSSIILIVGLSS